MKRGAILTIVAMAALGTGDAHAQVNFVFGNYSPPAATLNAKGIIPWLEEIEKRSGGAINTEFIGGGSVVTTKTGLTAMRDGLVDGAFLSTIYLPAETPVTSIFVDLGANLSNTMAASGALIETMMFDCAACLDEMKAWNVQPLGSWSTPGYDLLCTKEVKNLKDLKGLRIRASGHTVPLVDALGATPANLTMTEVYEALQRNQVECTFGSAGWLESYSLGESAKYVLDLDAGGVPSPVLIDVRRDLWEGLTEDQKKIFVDTAPIAVAGATWGYLDEESRALGLSEKGYKLVQPDNDVPEAIAVQAEKDTAAAIEKAKAKGVDDAQEIANVFLANYERWVELTKGIESRDAYAALLSKEIYSRYPMD